MKYLPLVIAFLLACSDQAIAAEPLPGVPATTNVRGADYPRILPDLRVVLRIKAPEAKSVKFQVGKAYDARRDADGYWTATTDPQVPGFHYYWLVIDAVQVSDPASETFYGTGKQTSGIEIPEPGLDGDYYVTQDVPHGEVRERWYHSKTTGAWRRFFIYTPPGYDLDRDTRYPVLYLQHGAGEDERAWSVQGRAGQILDNLIAAGKAKPMLVVMDQGYALRPGETEESLRPPPGLFDRKPDDPPLPYFPPFFLRAFSAFEDVMVQDLIPFVDATYRTIPDRDHRAIAGFSMGGMQAYMIGLRHLDTFASIGGLSGVGGGIFGGSLDPKTYFGGVYADADAFNARMRLMFIGVGTMEPERLLSGARAYHAALTQLGIKHIYYESPGTSHEWLTERRNLRELVSRLFR
jgi:enterochelin esterase-like enzyme